MSFSTQFLTMMDSTIKISTRSGHDQYGAATFGATTYSHRARIVEERGYVRGAGDETIEFKSVLWARSTGSTRIVATDRVTLPDGTTPPIVSVERYPDESGPNHVKIYLGA